MTRRKLTPMLLVFRSFTSYLVVVGLPRFFGSPGRSQPRFAASDFSVRST